MKEFKLKSKKIPLTEFGIQVPDVFIDGFENSPLGQPEIDTSYVFSTSLVRDLVNFFDCNFLDGLMIYGPKGSGKTTAVEQFCARVNYPLYSITCRASEEMKDWIGSFIFTNGSMEWRDGPLTTAVKKGYAILFNELDVVDPGELSVLNGILSGSPLVIPEISRVIYPHERFRLIAATNTNGRAGGGDQYAGTCQMNAALLDRMIKIQLDYMSEDQEIKVLSLKADEVPTEVIKKMVALATMIRKAHDSGEISITLSTRALVRWAIMMQRLQGVEGLLSYTLDRSFLNGAYDEAEKLIVRGFAESVFGQSAFRVVD